MTVVTMVIAKVMVTTPESNNDTLGIWDSGPMLLDAEPGDEVSHALAQFQMNARITLFFAIFCAS